jgi:hypothetical protein
MCRPPARRAEQPLLCDMAAQLSLGRVADESWLAWRQPAAAAGYQIEDRAPSTSSKNCSNASVDAGPAATR